MKSNREEYLTACDAIRRLSEEAHTAKWDEFLVGLEDNPKISLPPHNPYCKGLADFDEGAIRDCRVPSHVILSVCFLLPKNFLHLDCNPERLVFSLFPN